MKLIYFLILFLLVFVAGCGEVREGSKECDVNSNCIVFGKDGDCNCGCYNKDLLPSDTGGKCFCAAPRSCECLESICEGVFQ